jgi:hypothetical protein
MYGPIRPVLSCHCVMCPVTFTVTGNAEAVPTHNPANNEHQTIHDAFFMSFLPSWLLRACASGNTQGGATAPRRTLPCDSTATTMVASRMYQKTVTDASTEQHVEQAFAPRHTVEPNRVRQG